jgi:hypothetical protein
MTNMNTYTTVMLNPPTTGLSPKLSYPIDVTEGPIKKRPKEKSIRLTRKDHTLEELAREFDDVPHMQNRLPILRLKLLRLPPGKQLFRARNPCQRANKMPPIANMAAEPGE